MTSNTSKRMFFALMPDTGVRDALHQIAKDLVIRMNPVKRRVIPAENLHLTVQFLGDVTPDQQAMLEREARYISARPFEMAIDIAKAFSASEAWWVGPKDVPAELRELRVEVNRIAGRARIASDGGRFSPHVTLIKTPQALAPTVIRPIRWSVQTLSLVSSVTSSSGSTYSIEGKWPLVSTTQATLF